MKNFLPYLIGFSLISACLSYRKDLKPYQLFRTRNSALESLMDTLSKEYEYIYYLSTEGQFYNRIIGEHDSVIDRIDLRYQSGKYHIVRLEKLTFKDEIKDSMKALTCLKSNPSIMGRGNPHWTLYYRNCINGQDYTYRIAMSQCFDSINSDCALSRFTKIYFQNSR